jgi:predicted helicase
MYRDWAKLQGLDGHDTGIDLVAKTSTGEYHAIQCKLYDEDYRLQKGDIDSFFTASGKKVFTHRIIVSTTNRWSEHAEDALRDQQPPVSKIDLHDLENSQIDWSRYQPKAVSVLKTRKQLRDHQQYALDAVTRGLADTDRGKLIMACGTGKTFTSLKIAESIAGKGKRVLFLVPSLNLLSQTLTEWTQESDTPLHSFAVCSDSDVGKKRKKDDDTVQTFTHELRYPATTEPARLATEMSKRHDAQHMSVVFSTYHSIDVISRAQHDFDLADFDLIICDEAHRTTGVTFGNDDESTFVSVHNGDYIRATKRLYMTATPRIYSDIAEAQAEKDNAKLYGMNKEEWFGKELYVITFSEAVKRKLLVDYKVIVLAVEESHVSRRIQNLLKDPDNQLKVDDAAKIIGCWKALSKQGLSDDLAGDGQAMQRAVAFCQVIELAKGGKTHKVSSKQIAAMFQAVVEAYQEQEEFEQIARLNCEAEHVDGSMNASEKETKLDWLKAEVPDNTCRILSNVRCLSEGVDVPALDAVLFLTPRNSQVDVVQSVGRVMRNAPGKKRGYVILPVVIPAGVEPHEALNDNQTYKVVWQVLQALRSHDDRFDAMVNKLDLIGRDTRKMEVIAITDKIQKKPQKAKDKKTKGETGQGRHSIGQPEARYDAKPEQQDLQFEIGEIERAIYAKLVQKVGNRHHWEDWANDIAKIARTHIDRITGILENPANAKEQAAFTAFAAELRDDLNNSISDAEIIEMLAQHLITKPVFDALFEDYSFAQHNPMSLAMQAVLDALHEHHIEKEADTLQAFYDSVKLRAEDIDSAAGKQKIVVELYDKFFRNAFPKMTERLGIVYTPVEVVDFIIHSVQHILQTEFGQTLGSKGVHILDPFTGTGTFITRLLQSGLITRDELPYKYRHEIHANEIVLLAYYIAAINIEAVYHGIMNTPQSEDALAHRHSGLGPESSHGNDGAQSAPLDTGLRRYDAYPYQPFEGICLTDTFQMYEKEDLVDQLLEHNSARRKRQKKLDIRVIMGNPPYSAGQESANDNNQNLAYPQLDQRIRSTYAERSTATNKNALYNSYIRAIRWASDRIGDSGVIGFVTNAGWLEANTADGLRKCLAEEFSSIHMFHLRGNARTSGEQRRKEKDNVFGMGSRAPIAISLLVKNPAAKQHGQIYFHDIGDYLSREEKLEKISSYASIAGINSAVCWQAITPDAHGDWLRQRDNSFSAFIALGDKKGDGAVLFDNYSNGVKTQRDAWCYNACKESVAANMTRMITFYNSEVQRFNAAIPGLDKKAREEAVDSFINTNPMQISWTRAIKQELTKNRQFAFEEKCLTSSLYRPFTKQWLYFNRRFNEMVYQMPRIFPNAAAKNRVICVTGIGARTFSVLISDSLPCLDNIEKGQCFPLYLYDPVVPAQAGTQTTLDLAEAEPLDSRPTPSRGLALRGNDEREGFWRVEKMKVPKTDGKKDLTRLIYNAHITVSGIPPEAYDYVVNGKPALDWVVERQCVKTDKDSGIVNDANDWAIETIGNPRYPLELFLRVITVSLETMKIVNNLPALEIASD